MCRFNWKNYIVDKYFINIKLLKKGILQTNANDHTIITMQNYYSYNK